MTTHNKRSSDAHGFAIAELVVVVLVLGLAMIPIIRGMLMLPQVAAAIGTQNRSESWRSFSDQAVTAGIDPIATPVLNAVSVEPATGLQGRLSRVNLELRRGAPQIAFLTETFSGSAESRSTGGGFEVGTGAAIPSRIDPVPPLAPIKLGNPTLNPANGSYFALFSLVPPATTGDPYVGNIRAAGSAGDFIRLRTLAPSVRARNAVGLTDLSVSAFELAQGVRGEAWAEYNGSPATDIATSLADGRVLWLVTDIRTGRIQPYEPSDKTNFIFGVSIGRPDYSVAGKAYISGDPIAVDFATALNIASGTASAFFTYPQAVKDRFGSTWDKIELSYNWYWSGAIVYPCDPTAGDTINFYKAEGRQLWQTTQLVSATPTTTLSGLGVQTATWDVQQRVTALLPPERVAEYYDKSTSSDVSGKMDFQVPILEGTKPQKRIGRPLVDGLESVTDDVSIDVNP
jgi:hypothetical protein